MGDLPQLQTILSQSTDLFSDLNNVIHENIYILLIKEMRRHTYIWDHLHILKYNYLHILHDSLIDDIFNKFVFKTWQHAMNWPK